MFDYIVEPANAMEDRGGHMEVPDLPETLRALGDPTRLRIFDMLMEGVQCNCEIASRLGASLSLVSHHLHVLRRAGLVRWERDPDDARWIYYSVDREALALLNQALKRLLDADRIQPRLPSCGPKTCTRC